MLTDSPATRQRLGIADREAPADVLRNRRYGLVDPLGNDAAAEQRSHTLHLVNEREREHAAHARRLAIVDGLLLALDRWPEVIACVWGSGDRQTAHQRLCANLDLSDMVAHFVLDLPVGRTTELARHDLAEEATQLRRGLRDDPL